MTETMVELYERDFYAWTQLQARELRRFARQRPNVPLDLEHLAEEIRDLGSERKFSLESWTAKIMVHLLLLQHSPAQEPRAGWVGEIGTFRLDLQRRLTEHLLKSLRRRLPKLYAEARQLARRKMLAHGELEAAERLPIECPYTLDQVIDDWWPEEPAVRS